MRQAFLDPSVLLLAVDSAHPLRQSSRELVRRAARRDIRLHVSTEGIQEFVFHRHRMAAAGAVAEARRLRDMAVVHPFDERVLDKALELIDSTSIRGRDAVHAATAMLAGFDEIVSVDRDFDHVPGLRRVSPGEWEQE